MIIQEYNPKLPWESGVDNGEQYNDSMFPWEKFKVLLEIYQKYHEIHCLISFARKLSKTNQILNLTQMFARIYMTKKTSIKNYNLI